jgi:hypothetical protein
MYSFVDCLISRDLHNRMKKQLMLKNLCPTNLYFRLILKMLCFYLALILQQKNLSLIAGVIKSLIGLIHPKKRINAN